MNIPETSYPRVVILGGGFAGVAVVRHLREKKVQIVLLDRHNYHNFQPLLYQVATGGLEAGSIAYPLRKIIHNFPDCYFRLANVREVDPVQKKIFSDIGDLCYDYLIVATGSRTNYFGNKEIERNSMSMKTVSQSLNIRSLVLENFEQAVLATDRKELSCLMNFCIVGGGPTGVELAGALAEMKKTILQKDYPDLDISLMQINLIQSGDFLLNTMSEKSSLAAKMFLQRLGVAVHLNTRVLNFDGKTITTNSGVSFDTSTVIWTAGVQGAIFRGFPASALTKTGDRLLVNQYNQVEGFQDIFAVGDISLLTSEDYPSGLPMVAQVAIQQGNSVGLNLLRLIEGKPMLSFRYRDRGSMAVIGRNKAVVDLPKMHFHGFFAWLLWIVVHLFSLIGFRNKAVVLTNWLYNYIKHDREGRLIIRPYKRRSFTTFTSDEI
jgi:NADH:ubiquinone reductase (H+-translocating)